MAKIPIIAVATAIVHRNGKYLITQRSAEEKLYPLRWTVPGGTLENTDVDSSQSLADGQVYEVLDDLVHREVGEEVGVEITNLRYVTSLCYGFADKLRLCVSFLGEYASGEVSLNDELVDHAWVYPQEGLEYQLLTGIHEQLFIADDIVNGREVQQWSAYQQLVQGKQRY